MPAQPYKTTPIFDEVSLPEAIRSAHSTKSGVWGLLRVLAGKAWLVFHDPPSEVLVTPDYPGEIAPEAVHHVEIAGPVRLQVEFYKERPGGN
jgi:hemoglobin